MSYQGPQDAMKISFVHDWLTGMRGGEKVLEAACEVFPQAEIYTLIHRPERLSALLNSRRIHVSWLDSLPGAHRHYRYLLPLMPWAIESFDLGDCDVVLSSSHCVAKGVSLPDRNRPLHVCYCHTPMRYIYDQFEDYFTGGARPWLKMGARSLRPHLMRWDQKTSRRVDFFIANSENVRSRIQKAYGREAEVIYPPVDTEFFSLSAAPAQPSQPYYLMSGALVPYKRVDLAIEACRRLHVRLKIVGVGTEEGRLRRLAGNAPVEFLGWKSAEELRELYRNCEAFLFPADEDFGIAAVEAMACGRPVVAYQKGGALETVQEGMTGVFCSAQTPDSLAEAIARGHRMRWDGRAIREHARRFDKSRFKTQLARFVQQRYERHAAGAAPPRGRRLRVMQVIECGGPGGTGNQVAAICNGLDKSRFEVSLVYAVRAGSPQDYESLCLGADRFFHVPEMTREISPLSDARALWRLWRLFRAEQPDIVHAHSSKAGFLARVAARLAGVERIYYSPRGYSFLQSDRSAFALGFYRRLESFASRIGSVVAVSPSEASLAREIKAVGVKVIRDAYCGDTLLNSNEEKRGTVVCACGRLSFARNPEAFVRLAKRLTDARPDVRCVWIGDGELRGVVERLVQELGLIGKMEVTGWLDHPQALQRLTVSDIFVHYSRWEGLPNTVLEAMACGLPVVASDVVGNRDLVKPGQNGFLVSSEDELFERVSQLADDPELRKKFGDAGASLVRAEYSRERMLREISELYGVRS